MRGAYMGVNMKYTLSQLLACIDDDVIRINDNLMPRHLKDELVKNRDAYILAISAALSYAPTTADADNLDCLLDVVRGAEYYDISL